MISSWQEDAAPWVLFKVAQGDWRDATARARARGHTLQLAASLFDHFEMSMREPPYSLVVLLDEVVPARLKRTRVHEFLTKPDHCLSLFLRRLKAKCPRQSDMLREGARIIKAWNDSNEMSIHFSERSHGAFRLDVRSSGRGKNATESANRVLIQQAAAEHTARFQRPPAPGLGMGASPSSLSGDAHATRQRQTGGSSFICFYNTKQQAKKRVIAPRRALSAEERSQIRAAALVEWNSLPTDDKRQWESVHRSEVVARQLAAALPPRTKTSPAAGVNNLWSSEDRDETCLVACAKIIQEHGQQTNTEREKLAVCDPSLVVPETAPDRMANVLPDAGPSRVAPVLSCWQHKKNICRHTISREIRATMDYLTSLLNAWARSLGNAARTVSALMSLHGKRKDECVPSQEVDLCALLVWDRGNPRTQIFARCALEGTGTDQRLQHLQCRLPDPPFVVQLVTSPSRLTSDLQSMALQTSDEFCLEAAKLQMEEWQVLSLSWEEMPFIPSLLPLKVVGRTEFVPSAYVRKVMM